MTAAGILARYISWRFALAVLSAFALCVVLIFFVDFIELLRRASKLGSVPTGVLIWITLLRLPSFTELVLPFAVLIGSIAAFLLLSRSSELVVIRSVGVSVWQLVLPGVAVALLFGILSVVAYNPLAAYAKSESERLYLRAFGDSENFLQSSGDGAWMRQDGADGQSIMHARIVADQGISLSGVTIFQYDKRGRLLERVEAESAQLKNNRWELRNAWVNAVGREPVRYERYIVSTYLTPTQVRDSLGSVESISFWELPAFIDLADKAGLSATRHKLQYQTLLTRPFLLAAMVLVAATCSLRAFRFGRTQMYVLSGFAAGFAFFVMAEVSRNLGLAGSAGPVVAAWGPPAIACCLALTVLLHQEDG